MAGALDPSLLDQPVTALAGAGPVTAARLAERGLESVRDLLGFLPLGYEDYRTLYPLAALASLPEGHTVVVRALVGRVRPFFRRLLDVYLEQDGVQVRARWFRPNAGMVKTYAKGNLVALAGSLRRAKDGAAELIHPRNVTALMAEQPGLGAESGLGLRPRYPMVEKVPGRVIEKLVFAAVEQAAGLVPDILPAGVAQRLALPSIADSLRQVHQPDASLSDEKTGMVPHLLVLSATPIPRSLALTAYGDLDLTTLDESPPGRQVVATNLGVGQAARREAWAAVKAAVAAGGQGFVVCPAIIEQKQDGSGRRTSVLSRFRELGPLLAPARVGLLHGQMPSADQQEVVEAFRAGKIDVLVATTVLEVGVDVPAASIIVIEDAERFGLAQLHQLRGRVGRAGQASSCFLLTGAQDPEILDRLAFVAATSDGFRIAEEDLRRRGPGEIYGERQTGVVGLWLRDPAGVAALVEQARQEAEALLVEDPALASPEHAALRQAVETRWLRRRPIAEEAG